jgi:hypothetical protein
LNKEGHTKGAELFSDRYNYTRNGRFNIPVFTASTTINNNSPHILNCVLVGENPFNLNDW